tara:strand:- start:305 stop:793 length:489 start_codon:yes stop_codon:yes gene_type:complete
MSFDARAVANTLLDTAEEHRISIGRIALQKLLFFEQGWFLAARSERLTSQSFEAWKHGPVIRIVYSAFQDEPRKQPITERSSFVDFRTGQYGQWRADLTLDQKSFFNQIFLMYARMRQFDLVDMSHKKNGPWDLVWNDRVFSVNSIIPDTLIAEKFSTQIRN